MPQWTGGTILELAGIPSFSGDRNCLERASGLPFLEPRWKDKIHLNLLKNRVHWAWWGLSFLACCTYSRFLWPVQTMNGDGASPASVSGPLKSVWWQVGAPVPDLEGERQWENKVHGWSLLSEDQLECRGHWQEWVMVLDGDLVEVNVINAGEKAWSPLPHQE